MKKLLKKRFLLPLGIIAAVAVGGAVAYAAWTSTATSAATATTATVNLTANTSATDMWTASNLVPTANPAAENGGTVKASDVSTYGNGVVWHQVAIKNSSSVLLSVVVSAAANPTSMGAAGALDTEWYLDSVVLSNGVSTPGLGLIEGPAAVGNLPSFTLNIQPGATDNINIGVWLDSGASSTLEGQSATVTYSFAGSTTAPPAS